MLSPSLMAASLISKEIVCPGTFVLFSEGGGYVVGQIIMVNSPAAGEVRINVFCPPHPEENIVPLQQSYLHYTIAVSLLNYVFLLLFYLPLSIDCLDVQSQHHQHSYNEWVVTQQYALPSQLSHLFETS